jgi:hypothetical protein
VIDYRRKVLEQSGLDPLFRYQPAMELVIATAARLMRERDDLRKRLVQGLRIAQEESAIESG